MKLAPIYDTKPTGKPGGKGHGPTPKQLAVTKLLTTLNAQPNPMDAVTFFCPALGRSFTWLQGLN